MAWTDAPDAQQSMAWTSLTWQLVAWHRGGAPPSPR
jgi:hypothetical protein